jgi:hypothetical protein
LTKIISGIDEKKYFKFLTNFIISFFARLEEVMAFFPSCFGALLGVVLGALLGVWLVGRNSLTRIGIV